MTQGESMKALNKIETHNGIQRQGRADGEAEHAGNREPGLRFDFLLLLILMRVLSQMAAGLGA